MILLAGHSWECAQVVRSLSWVSVSESPGFPKSAVAPSSSCAGPLRENWYGTDWAIGMVSTGTSLCIGPSGLCNAIAGGSGISAKSIADALFRIILQDRGILQIKACCLCHVLCELYALLGIKSIRTSIYHPQTDGLVERFNRTLKTMIHKFVYDHAKNWLEPLLFTVREILQASTGFSPFKLIYGCQPRGVLDVLGETWEEGPSDSKTKFNMCWNWEQISRLWGSSLWRICYRPQDM